MEINNMSNSQSVYNLIKEDLNASAMRSKVIANNIANVNTSGYKRYYVTFQDTLNNSVGNAELETTNPMDISDGNEAGRIAVQRDTSSSMRQDGNNVDIDNEMTNLAANNLMYNALVSQANSRISAEKYVINGGN